MRGLLLTLRGDFSEVYSKKTRRSQQIQVSRRGIYYLQNHSVTCTAGSWDFVNPLVRHSSQFMLKWMSGKGKSFTSKVGKFHATIAATTPKGCLSDKFRWLGELSDVCPEAVSTRPETKFVNLQDSSTSLWWVPTGLPMQTESSWKTLCRQFVRYSRIRRSAIPQPALTYSLPSSRRTF